MDDAIATADDNTAVVEDIDEWLIFLHVVVDVVDDAVNPDPKFELNFEKVVDVDVIDGWGNDPGFGISFLSMDGSGSDDPNGGGGPKDPLLGRLPKDPLFKGDELVVELVVLDDDVLGK